MKVTICGGFCILTPAKLVFEPDSALSRGSLNSLLPCFLVHRLFRSLSSSLRSQSKQSNSVTEFHDRFLI